MPNDYKGKKKKEEDLGDHLSKIFWNVMEEWKKSLLIKKLCGKEKRNDPNHYYPYDL